jgi:hypothetical protein
VGHLQRAKEKARSLANEQRSWALLLVCSLLVALSVGMHCGGAGVSCGGTNGFGIAAGIISAAVAAACLLWRDALLRPSPPSPSLDHSARPLTSAMGPLARFAPLLGVLLSLWWLVAVCLLTFGGPFQATGNGYLATWGSMGAAVWLVESTGGFRNAWLLLVHLLEDFLGGSLSGDSPSGDAVEYEFNGVKPK